MLTDRCRVASHTTTADGQLKVVSIVALDGHDDSALLALAASLAGSLAGPLAAAIVESAHEREIEIRQVDHLHQTTPLGMAAAVGGHTVVLGNAARSRSFDRPTATARAPGIGASAAKSAAALREGSVWSST